MFRLKVKGPPRTIYELLESLGVEAETYITVNDRETLVSLIQQAIAKNLVVEIIPVAQLQSHLANPKHVVQQTRNMGGKLGRSAPTKASQSRRGIRREEREPKEQEEKAIKRIEEENGSKETSKETVSSEGLEIREEEISFDELMRLKEEAFSRKLVE